MAPFPLTLFLVNQMGPAYPVDRPSSKWFRTKICIILILDFLHSLSFLFSPSPIYGSGLPLVDFSPWDRPQHLQVFKKPPIIYFIPLSCPPSPLLIQLAHPTWRFSPRPWIFFHETGNRIDIYVQRYMDEGTQRVACNRFDHDGCMCLARVGQIRLDRITQASHGGWSPGNNGYAWKLLELGKDCIERVGDRRVECDYTIMGENADLQWMAGKYLGIRIPGHWSECRV